jgi:tetratricopeptide (TPR) repeat protein
MRVDVIDDFGVLTRLKDNWDAVYDSDPEAQIFLSWPWIANWFRKLDCPWVILAAKPSAASSSYVAFFPLQLQTKQTGRLEDALASFEKALSLNPDYAQARSNRAKVLHNMGRDG